MTIFVVDRLSESAIKTALMNPEVIAIRGKSQPLMLKFNRDRDGGSWYFLQYSNRKCPRRKIGNWPVISLKLITQKVGQIAANSVDGTASVISEFSLVSDLLSWYLNRIETNKGLRETRKVTVRSIINAQLFPRFENVLISELTEPFVNDRLIWPMQASFSLAYLKQCLDVLKTALRTAAKLRLIDSNPLLNVKLSDFKLPKIRPKEASLHARDLPIIFQAVGKADVGSWLLVLLMLMHGTRIGETRKAKWADFDFSDKTWTLPRKNTKTREHRLPLTDLAIRLLLKYQRYRTHNGCTSKLLFPSGSVRGISGQTANELIRSVSLGDWCSHDLRKLARTAWQDIGVDWYVGEVLLNHALPGLSTTYIHTLVDTQCREALSQYHAWLNERGLINVIDREL